MRITSAWLKARHACPEQIEVFSREWPKGVVVSLKVLKRAVELCLDLDWFAKRVLKAPAEKAYQEATASAEKAYQEAGASALKAYREARASDLWKALKKQEAR